MAENYVLLETIQLTQTAASITFDNIPQTGYTDLKIVISALGGATEGMYIQFNGSTANFSGRYIIGDGSTASTGPLARYIGSIMNQTTTPNNVEVYIPNYRSNNNKSFSADTTQENAGTTGFQNVITGLWSSSSAITSVTIEAANSFRANSTFSLYGLAALGTTPTVAPKATGGNIVATDGTYWYHAFLTSGTFTPQTALTCDYLVVAGGGAGGGQNSGGGGAGGLRSATSQSLTASVYPVLIGAGGSQVTQGLGNNGNDSTFNSLTSAGGGGGAGGTANQGYDASPGGSGGGTGGGGDNAPPLGRGGNQGNTPATTPSQGNDGGLWAGIYPSNGFSGGGGGGAGAAGSNATTTNTSYGGVGGVGSSAFSSWGLTTKTGHNVGGTVYYAGGGGGYSGFNGTAPAGGVGGYGGGGQGWASSQGNGAGYSGLANTGGGGGGGQPTGGTGGSGIVIIRYPK